MKETIKDDSASELMKLLDDVEKSRNLDDLLNDVIKKDLNKQFLEKQAKKSHIIREIIAASKIYERMPLERLSIKIGVDLNEILDLLENIILKGEFDGISISGRELIFKKIPKLAEFNQKPVHIMTPISLKQGTRASKETLVGNDDKCFSSGDMNSACKDSKSGNLKLEIEELKDPSRVVLRLKLQNLSNGEVKQISIKVLLPDRIKIFRIEPDFLMRRDYGIEIQVARINPQSYRRILIYLTPYECNDFEISFFVQYVDDGGMYNSIEEKIVVKVQMPELIIKENVNEDDLSRLVQRDLPYRGVRSFGLPKSANLNKVFSILKNLVIANKFKIIREKSSDENCYFIAWCHSSYKEQDEHLDIVLIIQILNNKLELFTMGQKPENVINSLTYISSRISNEFIKKKIIQDTDSLHELYCLSCGGILPICPEPGRLYTCTFCGAKLQF
ncbi:MAG: hypothetical protein ACTSWN_12375 [Promethearchaeota archaeon]